MKQAVFYCTRVAVSNLLYLPGIQLFSLSQHSCHSSQQNEVVHRTRSRHRIGGNGVRAIEKKKNDYIIRWIYSLRMKNLIQRQLFFNDFSLDRCGLCNWIRCNIEHLVPYGLICIVRQYTAQSGAEQPSSTSQSVKCTYCLLHNRIYIIIINVVSAVDCIALLHHFNIITIFIWCRIADLFTTNETAKTDEVINKTLFLAFFFSFHLCI